jgi:hypothetical protein
MKRGLAHLALAVPVLLFADCLRAELVSVRATPRQATVSADRNSVVSITWRISTTSDHRAGVSSGLATLVDPGTGEPLITVNTTFDGGGAGPFTFRETVVLDADTVGAWVARGVRQVALVRSFGDPIGRAVEGTAILRLSASQLQSVRDPAPSELMVSAIRLEFGSGNNADLVDIDETLRLTATLQYTGTGVLRGRWQIAQPESPDAMPAFRTLALVNTNLTTSQRSTLRSPVLPTSRSGRYLVRFSVTGKDGDLVAVATYRVQGGDARRVDVVKGLTPDRQEVDGTTVFRWRPVPRAEVYRLQVFGPDNEFVTGMVLDAGTQETPLSALVQRSLEAGRRYRWRVSAHDAAGQVVGESAEVTFIYVPAE